MKQELEAEEIDADKNHFSHIAPKDSVIRDTQTKTITKIQTIEKEDRNTIIEMISKEAKDFAARTVEDTVQDFQRIMLKDNLVMIQIATSMTTTGVKATGLKEHEMKTGIPDTRKSTKIPRK